VIRLRLFGHREFALLKGAVVRWATGGGGPGAATAPEADVLQEDRGVVEFPPAEDRRKAA
jgi:hypothetical protein